VKQSYNTRKIDNRLFGLDLFRSIAIVLVILNHSVQLLKPIVRTPYIGNLFGKFLALFQPVGMLGVELFFVLSGFLIGRILLEKYLQNEIFGFKDIFSFWKRRWFRTLPNYYLVLLLTCFISNTFPWKYFFFLQGSGSNPIIFFSESWSLAVEEWFYLLLPIFLFAYNLFIINNKKKTFLISIISFIVFFTGFRLVSVFLNYGKYDLFSQIKGMTFLRLDSIGYGVLMSYYLYFYKIRLQKIAKKLFHIAWPLSVLVTFIFYLGNHPTFLFYARVKWYKVVMDCFFFSVIPILFCLMLPYFNSIKKTPHYWLNELITITSKISYSLYLLHLSLILGFIFKGKVESPLLSIVWFLLYWVVCYALAYFLYKMYEVPLTGLRDISLRKRYDMGSLDIIKKNSQKK
jgi:peptidoglycan/LPS O-acetylase OafA/YrhL